MESFITFALLKLLRIIYLEMRGRGPSRIRLIDETKNEIIQELEKFEKIEIANFFKHSHSSNFHAQCSKFDINQQ